MPEPETFAEPPIQMGDRGPVYTETPLELIHGAEYPGLIAEPWNAATAFLFVVIVLVWLIRLRGRLIRYPFLMIAIPTLFVGGVGGTLYHGLRSRSVWFYMDVYPIYTLGAAVSIYYWIRLGPKIRYLIGMMAVLGVIQVLGMLHLPRHWAINLSYAALAILILVPLGIAIIRTRARQAGWVATAFVCFGIAWFFRIADTIRPPLLPMGCHWLWHVFGALTTAALSEYVYRLYEVDLRPDRNKPPN
jgi:hypothetical protein